MTEGALRLVILREIEEPRASSRDRYGGLRYCIKPRAARWTGLPHHRTTTEYTPWPP